MRFVRTSSVLLGLLAATQAVAATFCWDEVAGATWYNIHRGRMVYLWYSDPDTGDSWLAADYPLFYACDAVPVPSSYCDAGRCCAEALDVDADMALEFVTAFDPALPGSESLNGGTLALVLQCP